MDDDEYPGPMTAAEFRCAREALGLTLQWVADQLDVRERSVPRWEDGTHPVPPAVADWMRGLLDEADKEVDRRSAALDADLLSIDIDRGDGVTLTTFRTDADADAAGMGGRPAAWDRAVTWRVVASRPDVDVPVMWWKAADND